MKKFVFEVYFLSILKERRTERIAAALGEGNLYFSVLDNNEEPWLCSYPLKKFTESGLNP